MEDVVLQEEVTLNQALLSMSTFRNGCKFKLIIDGNKTYLSYGCCCLVNLLTGNLKLLSDHIRPKWGDKNTEIEINIHPEVKEELIKRKPCKQCGGFEYRQSKQGGTK